MIKYFPYKSDKPNKKYYIITKYNNKYIFQKIKIFISKKHY